MGLHVELLAYTEGCEKIAAAAAKLCYSSSGIEDILDGLTEEKTGSFLKKLADMGHESPIEHVSFTFGIEGVSRSLLAQITRHRIASYSVKSQRYVREGEFAYVVPPEIAADEEALQLFEETMRRDQEAYDQLVEILTRNKTRQLMEESMSEKAAKAAASKLANEDARFVLPNACETKMIVTMNARSLMNFFHHRCCSRAQWEIRALADEMLRLVKEVAPSLFGCAGPSCVSGACPEGKMSCGRMKQMREKYLGEDRSSWEN